MSLILKKNRIGLLKLLTLGRKIIGSQISHNTNFYDGKKIKLIYGKTSLNFYIGSVFYVLVIYISLTHEAFFFLKKQLYALMIFFLLLTSFHC